MWDLLSERLGQQVELEHKRFVPTGSRAAEIAVDSVTKYQPDLVLLTVGNYVFSVRFVWLRVRRLFGRRAGRWFRNMEEKINAATYDRGHFRGQVNASLRRIAHLLIGGDTVTTREECEAVYEETFKQLARFEDVQVAAYTYAGRRNAFRNAREIAERAAFVGSIRSLAEERHFLFIDTVPAFSDRPVGPTFLQSDKLHGTDEYQTIMGEFVAAALLEHVYAGKAALNS